MGVDEVCDTKFVKHTVIKKKNNNYNTKYQS